MFRFRGKTIFDLCISLLVYWQSKFDEFRVFKTLAFLNLERGSDLGRSRLVNTYRQTFLYVYYTYTNAILTFFLPTFQ